MKDNLLNLLAIVVCSICITAHLFGEFLGKWGLQTFHLFGEFLGKWGLQTLIVESVIFIMLVFTGLLTSWLVIAFTFAIPWALVLLVCVVQAFRALWSGPGW